MRIRIQEAFLYADPDPIHFIVPYAIATEEDKNTCSLWQKKKIIGIASISQDVE